MDATMFWTPSGVRLCCRTRQRGRLNWLFPPGGSGTVLTLIVSGSDDRIVTQWLRGDDRCHRNRITCAVMEGGARFPSIDNPSAVRGALHAVAPRMGEAGVQS